MILSWDVGVYNLAYCVVDKVCDEEDETVYSCYIKRWKILPICTKEELKKDKIAVYERIPKILEEEFYSMQEFSKITDVLIENQPCLKNPTMKSIQMMVYSFFVTNKNHGGKLCSEDNCPVISNIEFISPMNKLKVYDGPELECNLKSKYSRRKKMVILHTKYFMEKYDEEEWAEFFEANKKKNDDLADAYLQALFFISREHAKLFKKKRKRRAPKKKTEDEAKGKSIDIDLDISENVVT